MLMLTQADALKIPLADKSVHMICTSPPFWGLRDYNLPPRVWGGELGCEHVWGASLVVDKRGTQLGKAVTVDARASARGQFCQRCGGWLGCLGLEPTPELYVEHLVEVFGEVRRVLRDDGTVWLNLGDSYNSQPASTGISFRRDRARVLPSKSKRIQRGSSRWGGGNNSVLSLKPKDLVGIPWRVAFALQADGWYLRSDIIWHKKNPMPESVRDRPTKAHEYLFLLTKRARYFYDADAVREPQSTSSGWYKQRESGIGAGTKIYGASHDDKVTLRNDADRVLVNSPAGRNKRSVWTIATKPYKGAHFATFPAALVEPCVKAGTSERGVCPECGSPWKRVVEKEFVPQEDVSAARGIRGHDGTKKQPNDGWDGFPRGTTKGITIGWRPTCECSGLVIIGDPPQRPFRKHGETAGEESARLTLWQVRLNKWRQYWEDLRPLYDAESTVPAKVLDVFVGSGTTLQVARQLGRHGIGLDLSYTYLHDQARRRLALAALNEWTNGKPAESNLDGLPLFAEIVLCQQKPLE